MRDSTKELCADLAITLLLSGVLFLGMALGRLDA